jgi:hypothetical protein
VLYPLSYEGARPDYRPQRRRRFVGLFTAESAVNYPRNDLRTERGAGSVVLGGAPAGYQQTPPTADTSKQRAVGPKHKPGRRRRRL